MPLIDMPLEKLKTYMGSSPKPADFDEFWDRSLAEMRSIEPRPAYRRVETGSRFAECYELTFRSTKQAVIYAKFVRPRQAQGLLPVLLHFHGLSGSSDSWKSLYAYASQGYAVASMDCRGQGGKSEDVGGTKGTTFSSPFSRGLDGPPEDLLCRDLFLDTAMLARVVTMRPDVDSDRIGVFGGSQGGGLALACAALVPEVKLCAPYYPYLSDYRRVWNMDLRGTALLFPQLRPSARARGGNFPQARLHRRPESGSPHPCPRADGHRPDGHHLPALHAVCGLQQNHIPQGNAGLPRLRARNPEKPRRPRVRLPCGALTGRARQGEKGPESGVCSPGRFYASRPL